MRLCLLEMSGATFIKFPQYDCANMARERTTPVNMLICKVEISGGLCPTQRTTDNQEMLRVEERIFPREKQTNLLYYTKWSPLQTYRSNILWSVYVVFLYLGVCVTTIKEKENITYMNLKENKRIHRIGRNDGFCYNLKRYSFKNLKFENRIATRLSYSTPGHIPKGAAPYHKDTCITMFKAFLFIRPRNLSSMDASQLKNG